MHKINGGVMIKYVRCGEKLTAHRTSLKCWIRCYVIICGFKALTSALKNESIKVCVLDLYRVHGKIY